MDFGLRNAEGYYDLTAYKALKNVYDSEKLEHKNLFTCVHSLEVILRKIKRKPVNTVDL